jgi:hypothetical protein
MLTFCRFNNPPARSYSLRSLQKKEEIGVTREQELATDPVRARIIHVLGLWLQLQFSDFQEDQQLEAQLIEFIANFQQQQGIGSAGALLLTDLIENKVGSVFFFVKFVVFTIFFTVFFL